MIAWPDWEKCAEGWLKISEADIAFAMHKTGGPGSHGAIIVGSNNEYVEKYNELKDIPWASFTIVMAGNSKEEHDWQVKVLNQILEDTGGRIMPVGELPIFQKRDYINMIKGCFIPRNAFRTAGSFACPLQGQEAIDHCAFALNKDGEFREKYDEKGLLFNDGTNNMWGVAFEGGHFGLYECGHLFSPIDEGSWKAAADMMQEGREISLKSPLSLSWSTFGSPVVKEVGPYISNFHEWMKKIKKTFDPNNASDPSGYISVDD
jgi:glycolate oxidase